MELWVIIIAIIIVIILTLFVHVANCAPTAVLGKHGSDATLEDEAAVPKFDVAIIGIEAGPLDAMADVLHGVACC